MTDWRYDGISGVGLDYGSTSGREPFHKCAMVGIRVLLRLGRKLPIFFVSMIEICFFFPFFPPQEAIANAFTETSWTRFVRTLVEVSCSVVGS